MKETVFTKNGEGTVYVSKSDFNLYALILNCIYFAFKKDFRFALSSFAFGVCAVYAFDETAGALLTCIFNSMLANHRLHRFYLDNGYVAEDPEDQAWIAKNIKGYFGRA